MRLGPGEPDRLIGALHPRPVFGDGAAAYSDVMRIGVAGITGRMGRLVAAEIRASGAYLSGGIGLAGEAPPDGAATMATIQALAAVSDVIIDFTQAATVVPHAAALADTGCTWVLGTTGLSASDQHTVAAAALRIAVIQAANFSPGVALVLALAETLGAALDAEAYDAEILDMHHRHKIDAPSGTALALAAALAAGRQTTLDQRRIDTRAGARPAGGIGFASLRGGQIVGEHSLILTAADEQITLTHKAFDRRGFARGAVRAALWSAGKPAGLYGMNDVLGMERTR
jgi:4-hydroxy-tetrahydrodipicolinate reductase